MPLHHFALDYRRLPAPLRDRVALPEAAAPRALRLLSADTSLEEAVLLVTCHRCELYAETADPERVAWRVRQVLTASLDDESPAAGWRHGAGSETALHLCRVACGLDSSVLAETQILGQVRRAWRAAVEAGTAGVVLHRFFRVAIAAGKRARQVPDVAGRPASLAHVVVRLVEDRLGSLADRRVLIIGSGTMTGLLARAFAAAGRCQITIAARRPERAAVFTGGVVPVPLTRVGEVLAGADVVVSATSAPAPVLAAATVREIMARRGRPLLLVDAAVPRDIDPQVREIAGATLIDAGEIAARAPEVIRLPEEAVVRLEAIAAHAADAFDRWVRSRAVVPAIVRLRRQAERIQQMGVARALRRLPHLTERERAVVRAMAAGIVNRLLHEPTVRLQLEAARGNGDALQQALHILFALDREDG